MPGSASRLRCSPGASCRSSSTIGRDSPHLRHARRLLCLIATPGSPRLQMPLAVAARTRALASARYSSCSTRPSCLEPHPHRLFTGGIPLIAVPMTHLPQGLARHALALRARASAAAVAPAVSLWLCPFQNGSRCCSPSKFSYRRKPLAVLCAYAFACGMRTAQLPEGAGVHSSLSTTRARHGAGSLRRRMLFLRSLR